MKYKNQYTFNWPLKLLQPGIAVLLLLSWFYPSIARSQSVISSGTRFMISPGTKFVSSGNLNVKNGAAVNNAGTMVLKKDLANENTAQVSLGTGTVEFSGTAVQNISSQNIIQDLTVNNAKGLVLGGNTNVTGILTLAAGPVTLGNYNLLLGSSATISGTPSAAIMIVATGSGELRKSFSAGFTGSFSWPVGDATGTAEYSPVTLTFTAGTFMTGNYAGVKLVNSAYPGLTGNYLKRYWTITQSGIPAPQYNALFQYVPADVSGVENQLSCFRVEPTPWTQYDAANTALHQLTANGLSGFGTFTGSQTSIPCTLSATPLTQTVPSSPAGFTTFSVTTNCSWTAVSDQAWCTVTPSGSGNGAVTATYAVNSSASIRTANITVTVPGIAPVVVTVTQVGTTSGGAPVTIIPCVAASSGVNVNVPVTVNDFTNITALTLRIDYNPSLVTFQNGINIHPSLTGMLINETTISPTLHMVKIVWSDVVPTTLPTGSKLADLVFNYSSGTTSLTFNNTSSGGADCEYADATGLPLTDVPTSNYYINGCIHSGGYQISGQFLYNNAANTVLDSMWVRLKQNGIFIDSVRTDLAGRYQFNNKTNYAYVVSGRCTKPWSGVNGTDAQKVSMHTVGIETIIEPVRLQGADVNLSFAINGTDALKIKRRFVSLDNNFTRGDWTFARPVVGDETVIVNGSNVEQNFYGLCVGDVNGSNTPSPGDYIESRVKIDADGVLTVLPGQEFDLPVRVKNDITVSAISLVIPYPAGYFEIAGVTFNGNNALYNVINGEIRFVWSDLDVLNLKAGDELMVIRMKATMNFTGQTEISLDANHESEFADDGGWPIPLTELNSPKIKPLEQLGIDIQIEERNQSRIYPNPASDLLNVEIKSAGIADVTLELTDMLGAARIKLQEGTMQTGNNKFRVNTSDLPAGVYILKLLMRDENGQRQFLHKVVISR